MSTTLEDSGKMEKYFYVSPQGNGSFFMKAGHTEAHWRITEEGWGGAPRIRGGSVDGKESAISQDLKIVRVEELFLCMYLPDTYGALNKKQAWVVTVNDDSAGG